MATQPVQYATKSKAGPDLLTRMGGRPALVDFVEGFYDNMAEDKKLGAFLKKDAAAIPFTHYLSLLKERTVDFCAANFGDETYNGPDLFAAHAMLHINTEQYDTTMKCARKKLNKMKMPKSVANEVYNEVEAMRDPIVDPEGTFHKWLIQKNKEAEAAMEAEEDVVTNAMGFKVKGSTMRAWAEKAAKDEERKKKMKEIKAARDAEAAGAAAPKTASKAAPAKEASAKTDAKNAAPAKDSAAKDVSAAPAKAKSKPPASPKSKPPASPKVEAPAIQVVSAEAGKTPEWLKSSASTAASGPAGVSMEFRSSQDSAATSFFAPDNDSPGFLPMSRKVSPGAELSTCR